MSSTPHLVAALTQDLRHPDGTQIDDLIQVQEDIVKSLSTGQSSSSISDIALAEFDVSEVFLQSLPRHLFSTALPLSGPQTIIQRSSDDLPFGPQARIRSQVDQQPIRTHGPFRDRLGRLVQFDVFETISYKPLNLLGGEPVMYLSMEPTNTTSPFVRSLGPGSLRIRASLFASNAPQNSFFTLQILSGTITTPPVNIPRTVDLELSKPSESIENPAGMTIDPPSSVRFAFETRNNQPTGTLVILGDGNLSAFGTQFKFQHLSAIASYDESHQRVIFPVKTDASVFKPLGESSNFITFTGQSEIFASGLSLPVAVENPNSFTSQAVSLAYALLLRPGLKVQIRGQKHQVDCGSCMLLAEKGGIYLDGSAGVMSKESQILWLAKSPRDKPSVATGEHEGSSRGRNQPSFIKFRSLPQLPFTYLAIGQQKLIWRSKVSIDASLDQPRTINGQRSILQDTAELTFTNSQVGGITNVTLISEQKPKSTRSQSFALKNVLLMASPIRQLRLSGQYVDGVVTEGNMALHLILVRKMPFLPDPYATNLEILSSEPARSRDPMSIDCSWTIDEPIIISVDTGFNTLYGLKTLVPESPFPELKTRIDEAYDLKEQEYLHYREFDFSGNTYAPILLDLSSNHAQFGVMFPTLTPGSTISDLMLQAPASQLNVVTLPGVSWEPIREPQRTYFSAEPGPITRIASLSTTSMMPLSPREALRSIAGDFLAKTKVAARLSLPAGIVSVVEAQKSDFFELRRPQSNVIQIQPDFVLRPGGVEPMSIKGVEQISFQRSPGWSGLPASNPSASMDSPSFAGATALLDTFAFSSDSNVLVNILSGADEVSKAVAMAFRGDMKDKVPLTRFDITGYGHSIFSDWTKVPQKVREITKVDLAVVNGRTTRQTITLTTILAPFAVKLIRQIDVYRLNSGILVRKDSGYIAITDGDYNYSWPVQAGEASLPHITTHPGLVLRAENISNIRDVTNTLVRYDCTLVINDPTAPNKQRKIQVRDQLGYVFVGDPPTPDPPRFDVPTYMAVLDDNQLGGSLDFIIDVGESTQKMRITSMTITPSESRQEAVVALWGSLMFDGGGQWSMSRQETGQDDFPKPVDSIKGVPLIRQGKHNEDLLSRSSPYLFREPSELMAGVPKTIYGIIHGAPGFRVLFQQPQVPAINATKALLMQGIVVADKYALGTAQGIFPELQSCIPLNIDEAKRALNIVEGQYSFVAPDLRLQGLEDRIIKTASSFTSLISSKTQDLLPPEAHSYLDLVIKTVGEGSTLDVGNLALTTLNQEGKVVSKVLNSFKDEASKIGDLLQVQHFYGEALEQVRKVVSFLEKLKILPNFKVTMTNAWGTEMSTSMTRKELLAKLPAESRPPIEKILEQFDLSLKLKLTLADFHFNLHIKVTVKIPSGFGPTALGVGGFDVALGTQGTSLALELGCGIGVEFSVGPFHASASYAQSQTIKILPNGWGVGVTATLRANVNLVVASASLFLEASMLLVGGRCSVSDPDHPEKHDPQHHGDTIYAYAQVRICIEVSIFLVINVKVDEEAQWENKLNSGGCLLDNMIDL